MAHTSNKKSTIINFKINLISNEFNYITPGFFPIFR